MKTTRRCALAVPAVLALTALAPAGSLAAQELVRGVVRDRGSAAPIEGAMVVLMAGEVSVATQLSGADGSFRLVAPGPGRYEIRVDRIGYGSTYSAAFDVALGDMVQHNVDVDVQPIVLGGLDVSGSARCETNPAEGAATALVWEEARKALAAATWTSDRELYRFWWTRYVRDLDDDGRRVLDERRTSRRSSLPQPFESMHPDTLAAHGYVRDLDGTTTYLAPDAYVLLSDSFVDSHCLALTRRSDEGTEYIGLRFEPIDGRDLPDVEGVLWLDTETGRLTSLEYEYVNHRRRSVRGRDAHGRLSFQELPNGTWIVDEWSITMPRLVEVRDPDGLLMYYGVDGYAEEGGSVAEIATRTGVVVAGGQSGIDEAVTDSLESPVEDEDDSTLQLSPEFSSIASMARERCGAVRRADGDVGVLVGSVVDTAGSPVAAATVRAIWTEARGTYRSSMAGLGAQANQDGAFFLCEVPLDRTLVVTASRGAIEPGSADESGSAEVIVSDGARLVAAQVVLGVHAGSTVPEMDEEVDTEWGSEERAWLDSLGYPLRRQRALGSYTARQISEAGFDSMAELLSAVSRLELRPYLSGGMQIRLHAPGDWQQRSGPDASCEVDLYLNGSRVEARQGDMTSFRLDDLVRPRDVTAIEVFEAASAPTGDPEGCGAVLLWVAAFRHRDDPSFRGVLDGRVVGLPDDVSAEDVRLRLTPGGAAADVDDQARFSFGPLPPAHYRIEAEVPGWGAWTMEVEIRAASTVEAVLELGGAGAGSDAGGAIIPH